MKSRRSILFLFLAASLCCGPTGNTQTLVHPHPATGQQQMKQVGGLEEAKLLTPTEGWARSDKQLMFTTDQGATWKDITPTGGGADLTIAKVLFTSPKQGWVLRQKQNAKGDSWNLILSSTSDQGATWQDMPVAGVSESMLQNYSGIAEVQFSTAQHGWLALRWATNVGFSFGKLYETADGGRTWRELPQPPIFGVPSFAGDGTGYLIGGAGGTDAYKSTDGEQTWTDLKIPRSPGQGNNAQGFSDMRVEGQQITLLRTISPVAGNQIVEVLRSTDGGATWNITSDTPQLPPIASSVAMTAEGDTTVQAFRASGNGKIVVGQGPNRHGAVLPNTWSQSEVTVSALSFPNAQVGWVKVSKSECGKDQCTQGTYLIRTSDGGRTFQDAPVPFHTAPAVLVPAHPALKLPIQNSPQAGFGLTGTARL